MEEIPKLAVATGSLRRTLDALPPFPVDLLPTMSGSQAWRAYQLLSFLPHAYMWCERGKATTPTVLPARLAQPWAAVSKAVGMPPVLVYATYNLLNWRRLDPLGPVALGNIVCLNNFLGGLDEEHFRLVHIDIEQRAAGAIAALQPMQQAAAQGDASGVLNGLHAVTGALRDMQGSLSRMGENCDPYVYYHRVRLPMSGWRGNPALPQGLVYEGVSEEPVQLYGETGAQSSILHAFDAALGIQHPEDWLKSYLADMERHMPPAHRRFLSQLRAAPPGPSGGVRGLCSSSGGELRDAYNDAVTEMEKFRSQHKAFAFSYIAKLNQKETQGTGGSDFMPALAGYCATTAAHLI